MRKRFAFRAGAILLAMGLAARASPADEGAVFPGAEWATKAPAEVGLDRSRLEAFREAVGGRGCVVRHGVMAFSWGDPVRRADVASACKPWFSHFLWKAIEDGRLAGPDEKVTVHEPRLAGLNADLGHKDRTITWRHMANQVSCYGVAERPGEAFDYNDWQMALFCDSLFGKVYGVPWDEVDAKVLRPLLTDRIGCQDDPTFLAFGPRDRPGRLAISARDFARFGLLYLHKGRWKGQQVLGEDHASLSVTSPLPNQIPRTAGRPAEMIAGQRTLGSGKVPDDQTDHFGSYSFLWWTNGEDRDGHRLWPGAPRDTFAALGHGGRRALVVMPGLDLVVSWNDAEITTRERQDRALGLLVRSVVEEAHPCEDDRR
jgi:hypothetical protein